MNVLHLVCADIHNKLVLPAQAGIQRLKSLDPGQQHAGMTIKWDSNGSLPFSFYNVQGQNQRQIKRVTSR